ncbi:hypothetical protein A71_89 [Escherichia phage A7_1]|nr:hypothetical protein [Escherichia phage UPEC06]UZZ64167.1 hypothetical protein A71_89 [Escherichia phage A7_1]
MKKSIVAYKLFRVRKDGTIGPLFINRSLVVEKNKWMEAENHPTRGFSVRPGWHCTLKPEAPHLKTNLKSGEIRKWFKVEVQGIVNFQRPESQGGTWVLAERLRVLEEVSSSV